MKAQASIELMMILITGFVIFLLLAVVAENRSDEQLRSSDLLYAKKITDRAASEVNQLYLGGPGTNISFYVPATLENGAPFSMALYPGRHLVETTWSFNDEVKTYSSPIVGGLLVGARINLSGEVNLSNSGSVILIGVIENSYDYCVSLGKGYTHGECMENSQQCYVYDMVPEPSGDEFCDNGSPSEDTLCCTSISPDDYCTSIGYDQGICRESPARCAVEGEVWESGGDIYCIAGPSADTNCCRLFT